MTGTGPGGELAGLLPGPEARQIVMGVVLAYIDMLRSLDPPKHLTSREALQQAAQTMEMCARHDFGNEAWDSFLAAVRREAIHQ